MVPRDPTLSALLLIQHILSMTKVPVLYDSYSTASSFDPPTQNNKASIVIAMAIKKMPYCPAIRLNIINKSITT